MNLNQFYWKVHHLPSLFKIPAFSPLSLSVHMTNASTIYDDYKPVLLGGTAGNSAGNYLDYNQPNPSASCLGSAMRVGSKLNDTITRLIISFKSFNGSHASVSFCQYSAAYEMGDLCNDGLDNDCDGL